MGTPSNATICHEILQLSEAEVRPATRVVSVRRPAASAGVGGGWLVENDRGEVEEFAAVIFAGHDPSLPGWVMFVGGVRGVHVAGL